MLHRTRITVVGVGVAVLLAFAGPASANHEAPHDGPQHKYGEMALYDLVFPVVGNYWWDDWFWAARGSGYHHAQDLMAPKMTPVVAAASGTVTHINWSTTQAGIDPNRCCTLVIRHDDGWSSWYIHLNNDTPGTDDGQGWGIAPEIQIGTHVAAGDLIGWVGDSGNAEDTGPHLHFELYDPDGVLMNSRDALLKAEGKPFCGITRVGDVSSLLGTTALLKNGSQGEPVRQLQSFLASFQHQPGPIDGIFGPMTTGAVRTFQDARGLTIDGIVGSRTRGEIAVMSQRADQAWALDPDGRIMSQGARGGDVKELQGLLKVVGHDPGPADTIYGTKTTNAVKAFQAARGIGVDGIIGKGTRAALAQVLGLTPLVTCNG